MNAPEGSVASTLRSFDVLHLEACWTLQFAIDCWAGAWFHFGAEMSKDLHDRFYELPHAGRVTSEACEVATIITLGRLHDEKNDRLSIKTLQSLANQRRDEVGAREKLRVIRDARAIAETSWIPLKTIRDHAVAHAPRDRSLSQVFSDTGLRFEEVFACLAAMRNVLLAFNAYATLAYEFDPLEPVRADLVRLWTAIDHEQLDRLVRQTDEEVLGSAPGAAVSS